MIWEDFANPLTLADGDTLASVCFSGLTESPCPLGFDATCELVDEFGDPLEYSTSDGSITCDTGSCCVLRGDVNYDGADLVDIADLLYLIDFMFSEGPAPVCFDAADINGSGSKPLDISDLMWLINFMFQNGPPPVPCP
jgi:hypothetical protein